jgi:hypothetical protein
VLRHVVLLGWVPDATTAQRQAVLDGLAQLPAMYPDLLRQFSFGADARVVDGNYDLAVVADFDDADAYRRYAAEPGHRAIIDERITPILERRAAVQYSLG